MPNKQNLLDKLKSKRLLADGAMGTPLLEKGFLPPLEILNLSHPEIVTALHKEYIHAGAQLITTNTFGANTIRLRAFGREAEMVAINAAAVVNARAAGDDIYVAGNIGPCGLSAAEIQSGLQERLKQGFLRQVVALIEAGVDALLLETFTNFIELKAAVTACLWAKPVELPLIVCVSVQPDGRLSDGTPLSNWSDLLNDNPLDIIGLNCGFGPEGLEPVLTDLSVATSKPIALKLNAGLPTVSDSNVTYQLSPALFADRMRPLLKDNVRIIGACCGSTPEYIAALKDIL